MGIIERKAREKERRKNDIIDAAERVFFSKGLANATMDDVAEEAELSKGTLYLYFKSKEDLYLAINLRGTLILKSMFEEAVSKHEKGLDKTRAVGEAYFEYYRKYPDYFNAMLYYESTEIDYTDQDSSAFECSMKGKETLDVLIKAIETGVNDGSIRPEIDPVKTAIILWGQSTGIIQLVSLRGEALKFVHDVKPEDIIPYCFDLIGESLRAK